MLSRYFPTKLKTKNQLVSLLVILLVVIIGTAFLISSHAASPYASSTADSGTLAGGATKQSCSSSSDGSCVVFGGVTGNGQNWYVSTTGSDSNGCTQTSPCLTFNKAYDVAAPGDNVLVSSGTYGAQTINWLASKATASSNVIVQPAPGASVYLSGDITILSSHITLENMVLGDPNSATNKGLNKAPYPNNGADISNTPDQWADKHDVIMNTYPLGGSEPVDNTPGHYNDVGNITIQNIIARNFEINGAHNINILGGSYGPSSACQTDPHANPTYVHYGGGNMAIRVQQTQASGINNIPGKGIDPYNVTIDGITAHNIMSYFPDGTFNGVFVDGCHTEAIAIFSGTSNMKILNSKFYGNDIYDILAQTNSGAANVGNIELVNNWFAKTTASSGQGSANNIVAFDGTAADFKNSLVENNSFDGPLGFDESGNNPTYTNFNVIGNIGSMSYYGFCFNGANLSYNTWTNSTCGSNTTNLGNDTTRIAGALPFVNTANDNTINFSLHSGATTSVPTSAYTAIKEPDPVVAGQMDPLTVLGNDIDYHCRPVSGQTKNDAGASELNSTGTCNKPY